MNALCAYISDRKLNEVKTMNLLQDHGIISDECIAATEVGDADKAVSWLQTLSNEIKKSLR